MTPHSSSQPMSSPDDSTSRPPANAPAVATDGLFAQLFENHLTVQLLIDPAAGAIVDANPAAANF